MKQETIGRNIRMHRLKRGLTQEQLAEQSGLSVNHIGQVERGVKQISLSALSHVAEAMNTTLGALLSDESQSCSERVKGLFDGVSAWQQDVIVEVATAVKESLQKHQNE